MNLKKIVIFGATSAIATSCARLWVQSGCHLFLVGRNPTKLRILAEDLKTRANEHQPILVHQADLDDLANHQTLLELAKSALSGIDLVLIAHGTLPEQKRCERSVAETLQALHTNALSVISLATLAANCLEQQGYGTLAVISSVAGDRGRQSNYVYGSAKGMVSIFCQGLRHRLAKSGISVVTIKPGLVATPMTANFPKGPLWSSPERIARGIIRAVTKGKDEVYLPWFWYWIMWIIRHLPEPIFKRLSL